MNVVKSSVNKKIVSKKIVKHTDMGHIHEIMSIDKKPMPPSVTKLNKHEYVLHSTGEIKEYVHIENRKQSIDSLRKTFKRLRNVINNNFSGQRNELMFTLTYAENMTDTERLYRDFKLFMKALRRKYAKSTEIEYINVVEPQGRGAWHCHVLLRFDSLKTVYIPNKEIASMWGNGFVKVKKINTKNVDNIGAYLSAYLGDIELNGDSLSMLNDFEISKLNIKTKKVEGKDKQFIKGARLHLYPPGMKIYRTSKGISDPNINWDTYDRVIKKIGSPTKATYLSTFHILDDNGDTLNTISYEFYNTQR